MKFLYTKLLVLGQAKSYSLNNIRFSENALINKSYSKPKYNSLFK